MTKMLKQFFLLTTACSVFNPAQSELVLNIDQQALGNTPMPIFENVDYDILSQQVAVTAKYPMICNAIENSGTASQLTAAVSSPNKNSATSGVVGLLQSVGYDIGGGEISMVSENLNKSLCLTSSLHDVIFETEFEQDEWMEIYPNHFKFTGIEESQPVDQQFTVGAEYVNETGSILELDLIDFWPASQDLSVYALDNGISCEILSYDEQNSGWEYFDDCLGNLSEKGKHPNITLLPNYKIKTANKLFIQPGSSVGEYMYLMTAIYTKVNTIQSGSQNQSFSGVEFIEAKIKVAPESP